MELEPLDLAVGHFYSMAARAGSYGVQLLLHQLV